MRSSGYRRNQPTVSKNCCRIDGKALADESAQCRHAVARATYVSSTFDLEGFVAWLLHSMSLVRYFIDHFSALQVEADRIIVDADRVAY